MQEMLNSIQIFSNDNKIQTPEEENQKLQKELEQLKEKLSQKKNERKEFKQKIQSLISEYEQLDNKYIFYIIKDIENYINEETKEQISQLQEKISLQSKSINELNEEITYIKGENKKIKDITDQIIDSRNEKEIFFLEALDEIKREQYIKRKEFTKRGNFFPTLKTKYEKKNIQIDIKSFTPEMRERVLRLLFKKINEHNEYSSSKYIEKNNCNIKDEDISNEL